MSDLTADTFYADGLDAVERDWLVPFYLLHWDGRATRKSMKVRAASEWDAQQDFEIHAVGPKVLRCHAIPMTQKVCLWGCCTLKSGNASFDAVVNDLRKSLPSATS